MSTTRITRTAVPMSASSTSAPSMGSLLRDGAIATVLAAAATAAVSAIGHAAGASLALAGNRIPRPASRP